MGPSTPVTEIQPDQLIDWVSQFMDGSRLDHSVRVAETAKTLAIFWHQKKEIAFTAGILHDIAKRQCPNNFIQLNIPHSPTLDKIHREFQPVWHAFAGPVWVVHHWGVQSPKLLKAMQWHTTGRAKMSILEQILFIADYIEPCRSGTDVDRIRELAYINLDTATHQLCGIIIGRLVRLENSIFPDTIRCWNYYLPPRESTEEMAHAKIKIVEK